ncbi:hypothetical protein ACKWTF_013514 [Chironomus riparius]
MFLNIPAIFLVSDEKTLLDIFSNFAAVRYQNQAIKYFIYFADTTFEKVECFWLIREHKKLTIEPGTILHHSYFIINEPEAVSIYTIEWFVQECNKMHLTKIHSFQKQSMEWIVKLQAYEKFLEYNGCELKMMLPISRQTHLNSYHWGYAVLDKNVPDGFTPTGITPIIFKIAGKKYNFRDAYAPVKIDKKDWVMNFDHEEATAVGINKTITDPNVYFDITGVMLQRKYLHKMSNVFIDIKYNLFVTPGDPYTPYEKLFLPFDLTTWILLVATFGVTFITIFVVNRLPKSARDFVYGSEICTPTLNVISIFFGVSQAKLPTENFSRLILILFVFFCLIFRTCFQSKSFEFLTSVPRRPLPKTLEDLVSQNYTIYTLFKDPFEKIIEDERSNWPEIVQPEFNEYINYYKFYSQNSFAKMCLIIEDLLQDELDAYVHPKWNKIELENIFISHQAFIFHQHSFYFRMMFKTVNSLIDTGIMKHLTDNYLRQKKFIVLEEIPMSLKLNDLSYGFNIWLGFCGMSLIIFFVETMKKVKKDKVPIVLKFAKVHPLKDNC